MTSEQFPQYVLSHDDGASITVDQVGDQVAVRQSSQGTAGRGPLLLSANQGHELARQIEAASSAAARFTPPPPLEVLPTNLGAPAIAQALNVLGITPETMARFQAFQAFEASQKAAPQQQAPPEG